MRFKKGEIFFELEDAWIEEAGFIPLALKGKHYKFIQDPSWKVFLIAIDDVCPPKRAEGVPIFNATEVNGKVISARERTVSILRAIAQGTPLPPVKVVDSSSSEKYKFKLVDGVHKFHCSIAAGYSHIPAVYGIDIRDPYL